MVQGDSLRLQQVLRNLLGNAVKFTEQGTIQLKAEKLAHANGRLTLRISVSDTGIGIDSAAQANLFEPFIQANHSSTRQYGGTGLGLTISRRIVELMDGEIGVESVPEKGSTFWLVVTLDALVDPSSKRDVHLAEASAQGQLPAAESQSGSAQNTKRILIAEDNADNRDIVVMLLEDMGHTNIATVSNGEEALAKIAAEPFDLILMDCQMPLLDGYEATRRLRQQSSERSTVPIIALIANAMQGDRTKCLNAGMNDYLSKPFTAEELANAIEQWV
ncbi:MAG: response regulator [Cyanobacteria bacterium J06555_13]